MRSVEIVAVEGSVRGREPAVVSRKSFTFCLWKEEDEEYTEDCLDCSLVSLFIEEEVVDVGDRVDSVWCCCICVGCLGSEMGIGSEE